MMGNIYDDPTFFQAYGQMDRSRMGLEGAGEWHQFKRLFPELEGKTVLDLGCGYGWHSAYAAERGAASVTAIDQSGRMIGEARRRNPEGRIRYRVCSLEEYEYPEEEFELAVSNLVLHYIQDLDSIYRKVYRTLKSGGIFLINMEHPVFTGSVREEWVRDSQGRALHWPVDDYFYPGERRTVFLGEEVAKQHHTLTQILGGLLACGFTLTAVEEAVPDPAMLGLPGMRDEMRRPMILLVRAQKR